MRIGALNRPASRLLAAGAFLALASSTALASPREDLVKEWLGASSYGLPVTIGKSAFDPATQSVLMEDVVIGGPGSALTVRLPSLSVEDPRKTPTGMFAAHAIRARNMEADWRLDFASWFPEFARFGESRTAAEGQTTDGTAPATPPETVPVLSMKISAESVLIERPVMPWGSPDVDKEPNSFRRLIAAARFGLATRIDWAEYNNVVIESDGGAEGGKTRTSYGLIYASGIHDGRVERLGSNDVRQSIEGIAENPFKAYTVGSAYTIGVDIGAYLDAVDPAAYKDGKGDGVWHNVFAEDGYREIKVEFDQGSMEIGSVVTRGLRVRQTETPALSIIEEAIRDPKVTEERPVEFATNLLSAIYGLVQLDSVAVADISVKAPDDVSVAVGEVDVEHVGDGGIGAVTLRNADVKAGQAGSGSLDLFTINDIRLSGLTEIMKLAASAETGNEPDPKVFIETVMENYPSTAFMELAGLNVETPMGNFGLDSLAGTSGDFLKALPRRSDFTFTRAFFPVSVIQDPQVKDQLTQMGYEQIAISGAMTATYDPDKGEPRFEDVTVKVADMGVLSADLHLGNMPMSIFLDPDTIEQRLQETTLIDGSITFGNAGIVEKVFEVQAKTMNQKPDDFRRSFGDAMPLMLGFLEDKRIQQKFASVLKTFFNDPKSITLSFKPQAPLPFTVLQAMETEAPGAILDLLKVDVTANE